MDYKEKYENSLGCLLSILDTLKLFDQNCLEVDMETLSEMMFRKMSAYHIDLAKELNLNYLRPITNDDLSLDILESYKFTKEKIAYDENNIIFVYDINGHKYMTNYTINGALCSGSYLEATDGSCMITTITELENLIKQ